VLKTSTVIVIMRAVTDFDPFDRRPGLRVLVDGTAERMARALKHIGEVGDIFWGHDMGSGNTLVPQTMKNKIGILRETVQLIPGIDDDYHMDSWLKLERHATEAEVTLLQNRKIGVALPPEIRAGFRRAPETALQAYRTPAIHDTVHQQLTQAGNPVILIADGFADLEVRNPQADKRSRDLGYSALEMFVFGAGGHQFVEVIGAANLQFHQDELQRRSLKRVK
jgi:hypothetical protein